MIRLAKDDALWTVTLDRPDKANALTAEMLENLGDIALSAQNDARALIFTGSGSVFSAGADLDAARAGLAASPLWERLSGAIAGFGGLSIAALNGTSAGGSLGMVLACDLRVAVPTAEFFYPVMKLGFLPQPSDPGRLSALVGPSRTKHILMGGARITAQEALSWGLVNQIVEPSELLATAHSLCAHTLSAPSDIALGIKSLCQEV